MTIQTIPRRLPEVGRLRLGERQPTRNGTRPAALAAWRLTSKSRFRLEAAAKLYGGQVREWKDAPPEQGEQFELYTEAKALKVAVVAFYDNQGQAMVPYSQFYETWSAGGCQRRCNGRIETLSGEPCLCAMESDIPQEYSCDPITRFSVLLPDLPGLGSWRCESHGYYAAIELPGTIDLLLSLGRPVPVALVIDHRSEKRPGQPRRDYVVPMLDSKQSFMDLQMLAATNTETGELEMDEGRALAPPGPPPSPTSETDALAAQAPGRGGDPHGYTSVSDSTSEARGEAGDNSAASRRSLASDPTSEEEMSDSASVGSRSTAGAVISSSDLPPGEGQRVPAPPTETVRDQSVAVTSSPGPTVRVTGKLGEVRQYATPTSPPSGHPGKVVGGGDSTSGADGPSARASGRDGPPAASPSLGAGRSSRGSSASDPSSTTGARATAQAAGTSSAVAGAAGVDDDGVGSGAIGSTAVPDPAPDVSPVGDWCGRHGIRMQDARLYLRRSHGARFSDLKDWRDLQELQPPRSTEAIELLDVWRRMKPEGG